MWYKYRFIIVINFIIKSKKDAYKILTNGADHKFGLEVYSLKYSTPS